MMPDDGQHFPLRVFFDVDDTLITWDGRLRPHAHDVFRALRSRNAELFLWSGTGRRWGVAHAYDLAEFVTECFAKPLSRHHQRLAEHGVPFVPDFVVDDDADVVAAFGGTHVPAPLEPLEDDRELLRVVSDFELQFRLGDSK